MEFNPHSLHQILTRIREQMRCPQCGTRVAVDFPAIKLASDDFMLLQLKCESCSAFIVLHVNVTESGKQADTFTELKGIKNASSILNLDEGELNTLQRALKESGGSFETLFKKYEKREPKKAGG